MDSAEPGAVPYIRDTAYSEVNGMAGAAPSASELHMPEPKKPNNLRTALILASIALVFFIGVFIKQIWLS